MLPLLLLVALVGIGSIVGADELARRSRRSPWGNRVAGTLLLVGVVAVTIVAVRQGVVFAGLLPGIVVVPLLFGIAALLNFALHRLGPWAGVAFVLLVAGAVVLIETR